MMTHAGWIDAHVHFWQYGRSDLYWMTPDATTLQRSFTPDDLVPWLERVGVSQVVIVQAARSAWDHAWWFSLAEHHPAVAAVVGWVDLASPAVEAQLDAYARHPAFRGVRATAENEPDPNWLARPDVRRGIAAVAERGLTLDLLVRTEHLPHIPSLAEAFPTLTLVVDHLAKPPIATGQLAQWQERMAALVPYPNVWVKLSGLLTEAGSQPTTDTIRPVVAFACEHFGIGRMLWGSDWPVCTLVADYHQTYDILRAALGPLTADDEARLFRENARRVYRLSEES